LPGNQPIKITLWFCQATQLMNAIIGDRLFPRGSRLRAIDPQTSPFAALLTDVFN
jgi:hypothetical protein